MKKPEDPTSDGNNLNTPPPPSDPPEPPNPDLPNSQLLESGEMETMRRFLENTFESDNASSEQMPEIPLTDLENLRVTFRENFNKRHNLQIVRPLDSTDPNPAQDPGTRAMVDARHTIIEEARKRLRQSAEAERRAKEEKELGPRGEQRSKDIIDRLEMIPLEYIRDDKDFHNLRVSADNEEMIKLVESMRYDGLKVPITVIPVPGDEVGFYVRAGFRRTTAAQQLRWSQIPAIILPVNTPLAEEYWTNIIENSARAQLTSYEIARAAQTMKKKFGISTVNFALRAGYSEQYVSNLLRCIEKLPPEIVEAWKTKTTRIPTNLFIKWTALEPQEALREMKTYAGANPQFVKEWTPGPPKKQKPPIIKMATAKGLERMQRVRYAIEMANTIDDKTRHLCLNLIDFCSGAREDVPTIYNGPPKPTPEAEPDLQPLGENEEIPTPPLLKEPSSG